MDYGKTPTSNFELDNFNLDTNEWQNTTPERDPRAIGNRIIFTPENSPVQTPEQFSEVAPSMPPGYQPAPAPPMIEPTPEIPTIDEAALKTEDRLDPRAVKVVDEAIHKLDQDGNIADFYDTARGMMETNLENSYNRKLAA